MTVLLKHFKYLKDKTQKHIILVHHGMVVNLSGKVDIYIQRKQCFQTLTSTVVAPTLLVNFRF